MVAYPRSALLRRQGDPLAVPTGAGLTNIGITASAAPPVATGLAFDPNAGTGTLSAPPLDATGNAAPKPTPTFSTTQPVLPSDVSTDSQDIPSPTALAASSKPIALSTVIGTCIGAFIGASALIIFGLWVYRRYSQSLKQRAGKSRGPFNHRNIQGNERRRRSRLEAWNKLEDHDAEDKWEGSYQTKEAKSSPPPQIAPMEKLNMFKKTPSVRTAYTHKSTDGTDFSFPSSYAEFDPNLAATLKLNSPPMPEPKPFLNRVESKEPESATDWDDSKSSYITVHTRLSGAMSPSLNMAIPTPPLTVNELHRWESAEVVQYAEAQAAEVVNPFDDSDSEVRKSRHNPFFGASARDFDSRRRRSTSTSSTRSRSRSRSRVNSTATTVPEPMPTSKAKGKERMRYSSATDNTVSLVSADPFGDPNDSVPRPAFMTHVATSSTSSMDDKEKERALKSLIAALDIPEDEVRDRLRIASMQPSILSQTSSIGGVSDVTKEFPLPPSTPSNTLSPGGFGSGYSGYRP